MMARTTVTGAAEPCSTISASLMWTPSDTLPGGIASAEPDIQFLTLADVLPEPATCSARSDVVSAFVSGAMMSALAARATRMRRRALQRAAR